MLLCDWTLHTLLPPASSTPATPGSNTPDVPTAEAPKVDTPKNEGVTTETPKVTDGSTGTGVATPTTPVGYYAKSGRRGRGIQKLLRLHLRLLKMQIQLLKRLQLPLKEVKETLLLIQLQLHQKHLPLQSTQ